MALAIGVCLAVASFAAVLSSACAGDGPVGPVPDTTAPVVDVLFPTSPDTYDEDGDGLADFRIAYRDSAGAIAVAQLTAHSLRPVDGPAAGEDLLTAWTVDQRDDTLLVFHETIANLLPSQTNRIVVAVADTAGNVTEDTIRIELPYGALHTTIETGMAGPDQAGGLTYCSDDHLLYVNAWHGELAVVDPDAFAVLAVAAAPGVNFVGHMLCVPDDPALYITGEKILKFDRTTRQWLSGIAGSVGPDAKLGLTQSKRDPNRLYVGTGGSGVVFVVDRAQAEVVDTLLPIAADKWVYAVAALPDDAALYATVFPDDGMVVLDPWTNEVRDTLDLSLLGTGLGYAMHVALTRDASRIYAAVTDATPAGVYEFDTRTNLFVHVFELSDYRVINLALSPDEQRMFVTTQDRFATMPSPNVLVDVATWTELARFPRPRPLGETRWDQHVVFHPNGKLIFVAHNENLDVYLNRR